jgi:hypothetical protein
MELISFEFWKKLYFGALRGVLHLVVKKAKAKNTFSINNTPAFLNLISLTESEIKKNISIK